MVLIAGPTASGKSAMALEIASRHDGVIVNADSMQVYDALPILTARPSHVEMQIVPHRLYAHVPADIAYSSARWLDDAAAVLGELRQQRRMAVVVGGTGLYFTALLAGLSPVPPIDPDIRRQARELAAQDREELFALLRQHDPQSAERFAPADTQRATRALEVVLSSGRTLGEWQAMPGTPVIVASDHVHRFVLEPPRALLHQRIETRFDQMIEQGALEEVRAFAGLEFAKDLPIMKAIGFREIEQNVAGIISLPDSIERAKAATRQYAKRQSTWFRGQFDKQWQRTSSPRADLK